MGRGERPAAKDERSDREYLEDHQAALERSANAHAEAVDRRQQEKNGRRDGAFGKRPAGQIEEVAREGDGDRGHAARLNDEKQRPSVEEGRRLAIGIPQIGILAADLRPPVGQFGIDQRARHGDQSAQRPYADDQAGRLDMTCDLGGIDEYAGSDNPAHDQHRCVERPKTADQAVRRYAGRSIAHSADPMTSRIV